MDTSEQYIKMCDTPEIQGQRPLENYLRYDEGDILHAHWPDGTSYPIEKRERRTHLYTVIGNNPEQYSKPIWLPRQDQLQEMVTDTIDCPSHSSCAIFINVGHRIRQLCDEAWDYWMQFKSMEQLWMAFVMKEKFNKIWRGEEWIV